MNMVAEVKMAELRGTSAKRTTPFTRSTVLIRPRAVHNGSRRPGCGPKGNRDGPWWTLAFAWRSPSRARSPHDDRHARAVRSGGWGLHWADSPQWAENNRSVWPDLQVHGLDSHVSSNALEPWCNRMLRNPRTEGMAVGDGPRLGGWCVSLGSMLGDCRRRRSRTCMRPEQHSVGHG